MAARGLFRRLLHKMQSNGEMVMATTNKTKEDWRSTTNTGAHFEVSTATVGRWRYLGDFPHQAIRARGVVTEYDIPVIAAWLKSRPKAPRRPYKCRVPSEAERAVAAAE
jgi:hypothetical protein